MQTMYNASVNSPSTEVLFSIDDHITIINVRNADAIPDAPNLLTLGYDTENPETVLLLSKTGTELTVQRGFQGVASAWEVNTKIARVFTAYDYEAFKVNIEELQNGGGGDFFITDKFIDNQYIYFIGDLSVGWKVNRYDYLNNLTTASGTTNKPTTLIECQGLVYN